MVVFQKCHCIKSIIGLGPGSVTSNHQPAKLYSNSNSNCALPDCTNRICPKVSKVSLHKKYYWPQACYWQPLSCEALLCFTGHCQQYLSKNVSWPNVSTNASATSISSAPRCRKGAHFGANFATPAFTKTLPDVKPCWHACAFCGVCAILCVQLCMYCVG